MRSAIASSCWPLSRARTLAFGVALVIGLGLVGRTIVLTWWVGETGISDLSGKPPTWDFTNLWMGGRLAMTQTLDVVFKSDLYRDALRAAFGPTILDSEWSYPPSMLLIGAPLSLLPLYSAYALWTIGGLAALVVVCRAGGLSLPLCGLVAISPAVALNGAFGQNGAWTAALLLGGLLASERRPILAGLLFGLLTMKPHLGMLAPICLIAAGRWRAIGWSAVFSIVVAGMTTAVFGLESWRLFLSETRPLMQSILEAKWGDFAYQANAMTVFLFARSLGASLVQAYGAQLAAATIAAAAAWRLWRAPHADPLLRAVTTALLTLLATPYGWSYDLTPLSVAVVALAAKDPEMGAVPLGVAFVWPATINRLSRWFFPITPLVLALVAAACWRAALGGSTRDARVSDSAGRVLST